MAIEEDIRVVPGTFVTRFFNPVTGVETNAPVTQSSTAKSVSSRVVKPNKRPRPRGWLYPTAYERREVIENNPRGFIVAVLKSGSPRGRKWNGYLSPGFIPGPVLRHNVSATGISSVDIDLVSQAEAKALVRLTTHGKDRDGTWKPGIAWRERKETADLLTDAARRTVGAYEALRQGNWRKAFDLLPHTKRPGKDNPLKDSAYWKWLTSTQKKKLQATPRELASGFLALQNGWKPLLGDISNAAEALGHRNTLADWVITGVGTIEKVDGDHIVSMARNTHSGYSEYPNGIFSWKRTRRVKVRLDATITNQQLHLNAQLGLNNIAHTIWETTPLSYIVDYFLAVGKYLEALGAADGMQFMSGSVTRSIEYLGTNQDYPGGGEGKWIGESRYFSMDRRVYNSFPVPIFPLSLKPEPLKLSQFFNILSVGYLGLGQQKVPYSKMG